MDALDLFPTAGIRFVSVAHEQAAAHAADGLARVTGRPQVCIGQNGPGAANFVSAITAAFWAHNPVVAITPETGSAGIGTGGFQELDQMSMFEKSCVYQVRVNRPERMAELTRRAFYMAKAENGLRRRDLSYSDCFPRLRCTKIPRRCCRAFDRRTISGNSGRGRGEPGRCPGRGSHRLLRFQGGCAREDPCNRRCG